MKRNYMKLGSILLMCLFVAFMSCEGPEGAAGENGVDGIAGTNGENGEDGENGINGAAECMVCHNESTVFNAKQAQFTESAHSLGTYYTRSGQCAGCHSNEGFLDRMNHAAVGDIDNMTLENQTPISCYTCHNVHQNYDDTDWDLTFTSAVTETLFGYTSPDHDSYAFEDKGDANMCFQCHQARDRGNVPGLASTVDVSISTHWGPHYGVQGNVLNSKAGIHFDGAETYPTEAAKHDCIKCHMADGDHTLTVNYDACTECHDDMEAEFGTLHTEVHDLLFELGDELATLGVMIPDIESEWIWDNVNEVHLELIDTVGYYPAGGYGGVDVSADYAKAVWNYMVVYQDHSYGAHNPDYILALLKNTLATLD